ncbi:MAG: helix-turn-helix domain-containing protein [Lachnospiraceae bacterium]
MRFTVNVYILDTATKRRIQMIELLNEQQDWISIKEIAQRISCSERIINNDIRFCNAMFRHSKIITSQFGVRYKMPVFLGMRRLYQMILEQSVEFQLLETVFLITLYPYTIWRRIFISVLPLCINDSEKSTQHLPLLTYH